MLVMVGEILDLDIIDGIIGTTALHLLCTEAMAIETMDMEDITETFMETMDGIEIDIAKPIIILEERGTMGQLDIIRLQIVRGKE